MKYCIQVPFEFPVKQVRLSKESLVETACTFFDITKEQLLSGKRCREFVIARQMVMYFFYNELDLNLVRIADFFNRDHSTVIYNLRSLADLCQVDRVYKRRFDEFVSAVYCRS